MMDVKDIKYLKPALKFKLQMDDYLRRPQEFVFGVDQTTGRLISTMYYERFGHTAIFGRPGSGKTSKGGLPGIWQDLILIKEKKEAAKIVKYRILTNAEKVIAKHENSKNIEEIKSIVNEEMEAIFNSMNQQDYNAGLTVIEPKGDLVRDVKILCDILELTDDVIYIYPGDESSDSYNFLAGEPDTAAEDGRQIFKALFRDQEEFFSNVQQIIMKQTILLLKRLNPDIDILDTTRALRDGEYLKKQKNAYKRIYGEDDLTTYFEKEVFGAIKDKYYQFALGLRTVTEDIANAKLLQPIVLDTSTFTMDDVFKEGKILLVNTALGELGSVGDNFGSMMFTAHQNATFRRPGDEDTRPYHFTWVDEASRYMSMEFEKALNLGRSARNAQTLMTQTPSHYSLKNEPDFRKQMMNGMVNKITYQIVDPEDAEYFEKLSGMAENLQNQYTYEHRDIGPIRELLPRSYRTTKTRESRIDYTSILELKSERFEAEALAVTVKDGKSNPVTIIDTYLCEALVKYKKSGGKKLKMPGKLKYLDKVQKASLDTLNSLIQEKEVSPRSQKEIEPQADDEPVIENIATENSPEKVVQLNEKRPASPEGKKTRTRKKPLKSSTTTKDPTPEVPSEPTWSPQMLMTNQSEHDDLQAQSTPSTGSSYEERMDDLFQGMPELSNQTEDMKRTFSEPVEPLDHTQSSPNRPEQNDDANLIKQKEQTQQRISEMQQQFTESEGKNHSATSESKPAAKKAPKRRRDQKVDFSQFSTADINKGIASSSKKKSADAKPVVKSKPASKSSTKKNPSVQNEPKSSSDDHKKANVKPKVQETKETSPVLSNTQPTGNNNNGDKASNTKNDTIKTEMTFDFDDF